MSPLTWAIGASVRGVSHDRFLNRLDLRWLRYLRYLWSLWRYLLGGLLGSRHLFRTGGAILTKNRRTAHGFRERWLGTQGFRSCHQVGLLLRLGIGVSLETFRFQWVIRRRFLPLQGWIGVGLSRKEP